MSFARSLGRFCGVAFASARDTVNAAKPASESLVAHVKSSVDGVVETASMAADAASKLLDCASDRLMISRIQAKLDSHDEAVNEEGVRELFAAMRRREAELRRKNQ
ncbi:MAG: hypothetical protein VW879_02470 [Opitutae bacterium]